MKEIYSYDTRFGKISIATKDKEITNIWFDDVNEISGNFRENEIHKEAFRQISEYFKGERKLFDLPLNPQGTDFQKKVWKELVNIPYGETSSYKEIAERVNSPKGYRAVGMCNNKNPIPIIYPCHRVLGSDGKLTGYAYGLDMKRELLDLERENKEKSFRIS